MVVYVDDCLIFTPKKKLADELIVELASKFTIEDKGDISGYLGINITRPSPGVFELNQPALIQRIIDFLGLKDNRFHDTLVNIHVRFMNAVL